MENKDVKYLSSEEFNEYLEAGKDCIFKMSELRDAMKNLAELRDKYLDSEVEMTPEQLIIITPFDEEISALCSELEALGV